MEKLPGDLFLKIFCLLNYKDLAIAQQVCKKWEVLASDNILWSNLFKQRWGEDTLHSAAVSSSWKDIFEVQDRRDRVGSEAKVIREGIDYYLVREGVIQHHLGSRRRREGSDVPLKSTRRKITASGCTEANSGPSIFEKILFFIGDLEVASTDVVCDKQVP